MVAANEDSSLPLLMNTVSKTRNALVLLQSITMWDHYDSPLLECECPPAVCREIVRIVVVLGPDSPQIFPQQCEGRFDAATMSQLRRTLGFYYTLVLSSKRKVTALMRTRTATLRAWTPRSTLDSPPCFCQPALP